ncbi:MAG: hypothetical protein IJH79_14255, partial [Lentisphaeria bacterium]|nr:hypothetical protein [Lentisphaeria bacterium]
MDEITEKPLRTRGRHLLRGLTVLACLPLLLCILYGCRRILLEPPKPLPVQAKAETALKPLTTDEQAALRWLDHVLAPQPKEEERKWWQAGKLQFGLSSTRYHIAFAGYAAAALGIRGNAEQKAVVARILENCITRYLKREVWAYSQAKNYCCKKPWAAYQC